MARILLPTNTLVGRGGISIIQQLINVRQHATRLKEQMDAIVGATPVLLETDQDGLVPAGQGLATYNDFASLKATLDGLLAITAKYDRG